MKQPKMVKIEWKDVMSTDMGLFTVDDLVELKPCIASMVGWLVKEDDEAYYIAKEFWENGQFKYLHVFPKDTAIVGIKELVEKRR